MRGLPVADITRVFTNHPDEGIPVTDPKAYWDTASGTYHEWWVPVVGPSGIALLDRLGSEVPAWGDEARELLDLGTGTGTLAIESVRRWPNLIVTGADPAPSMLELAERNATSLAAHERRRLRWVEARAEHLPFDDGSLDAVVSAFVYQFFMDRQSALAEIRRVLRPRGVFAWVTWEGRSLPSFTPDDAFEEVLGEWGLTWLEGESPPRKRTSSPRAAAEEMRRAGFRQVSARAVWLEHQFDRETYLGLLEHDDAPETFAQLKAEDRDDFKERVRLRWQSLPDSAFLLRRPLVSVVARSP